MGQVIVMQFSTLDGVIEDPSGAEGTANGGWAFRYGPEAVAGDKFVLGPILDTGLMLLGRTTWEMFARIWPSRTDEFSRKMNAIPKLVASRSLTDVSAWANSSLLQEELVDVVAKRKEHQDIVITGSASVVAGLRAHDLVDQYRLMIFPIVLGEGRKLFERPLDLRLASAEQVGQAVRVVYNRAV
ncbi:dihydrofolate reductase family protein [Actinocrispum sp. NPDC049592]|uniref:dihydrofolate reductase family protein n=1 Tax=Actinocrispum sp. NPDC049592 TaxID=3154835 RepID=UPI003447A1D2